MMNLLTFMSFLILAVTILTMIFGVVSYFMYKARERKKEGEEMTYDDILSETNSEMLFFVEVKTL